MRQVIGFICVAIVASSSVAARGRAYSGASEKVVYAFGQHNFDAAFPEAGLLDVGGILYGTTFEGGTSEVGAVFSVNPATGVEKVVCSFNITNGAFPTDSLINVGGLLYGTTEGGGAHGFGTVFVLNPATGVETVVYSFAGGSDGYGPYASLIYFNGELYGTTIAGGTSNLGTVFVVDPVTTAEKVVYSFKGGSDGAGPFAALIDVGGTLYGTTGTGGATSFCTSGCGTIFSLAPATGAEKVLYDFQGSGSAFPYDGSAPLASLTDAAGILYGTTSGGGNGGFGTVFAFNPVTTGEEVVYSFKGGSDGSFPYASLIDVNGTLYGTTYDGLFNCESGFCGTVFAVKPASRSETVIHSFPSYAGDGKEPQGSLVRIGSTLYGTTSNGGSISGDLGTVFAITR